MTATVGMRAYDYDFWGLNRWFSTLAAHFILADPEEIKKVTLEKGKINF